MFQTSGKIPRQTLEGIVLQSLGLKRKDVLLGAAFGEDAALLNVDGKILAASSDPITGALARIGWLAVHANANDIATRGIRPRWFLSNILLPETADERQLQEVCTDIDLACRELDVAVVGGHSEYTPGISRPIVVGCMLGTSNRRHAISCRGARAGDELILTKAAGIEGTAILACSFRRLLRRKLHSSILRAAESFDRWVSVVPDALSAFEVGGVHAMHDPTEGGLAGGLHELADAAGLGFIVDEQHIAVYRETRELCKLFNINPLNLIGSGALLIACSPRSSASILRAHRRLRIRSAIIGRLLRDSSERLMVRGGRQVPLPRVEVDELWRVLREFRKG